MVEIAGFGELTSKIRLLKDRVKKREMLKILRQVAHPTLRAARAAAPVSGKTHIISGRRTRKVIEPENLRKSIGNIVGRKGLGKQNAVLYIGPRSKGKKHDGWYGMFVQGGTKKQKANPFMSRAYAQTKGQVTADAEVKVAKAIQKQIDKLSK